MKLTVKQTCAAGKLFWIIRDTDHGWLYSGPFVDEATARAGIRAAWKELFRAERITRKQAALAA